MVHFYTRIFLVGLTTGLVIAILLNRFQSQEIKHETKPRKVFNSIYYKKWISKQQIKTRPINFDDYRYGNGSYLTESEILFHKIPVLCIVLVKKEKNARAINETWAKSCNSIKFLSLANENKSRPLPVIKAKRADSSWTILCNELISNVPDKFKWTIIVNDYTFAIIENLRYFLAGLNSKKAYYLGHTVQFWNTIYNLGQAGYVLSRGTIRKLKKSSICANAPTYQNREDFYLGKHLNALEIFPLDTRDDSGLSTFLPNNLLQMINPSENEFKQSLYPQKCCSKQAITFQAIEGDKMYTYYYLLYTMQLFNLGGYRGNKPPPAMGSEDQVWKEFAKSRGLSTDLSADAYYKAWEDLIDDPTVFAEKLKREEYDNVNF